IELPGHAPGLIGLFRESDRLALVSDCIYTLDPQTGIKGAARVPHPAFNADTEQARASIRKLAALDPATVWAGHADPVSADVAAARASPAAAARAAGAPSAPLSWRAGGRRQRQREKLKAPPAEYRDAEGNTLVPRGSLTPAARREYADVLEGGLNREDAWQ